ncbi:RRQRL motif-containing zinc-binding protein [Saccharothrix deserti]|uniref:RRQRL motif-containing zinc-binding protein n=1 Tax=Saccharothrix deserti TaxID=2593674 RepID=UPI00131E01E2|nr:RRQRL motif-containing zinc-binding protein [Saccharothrix deserti]
MGRRTQLATVVLPWNGMTVFCRGERDGLPVFGWGTRPGGVPKGLCTRRQLRAKGLRPGGADPDALLVFRHRIAARAEEVCELWREEVAVPVRAMTPGRWKAHDAAMRARRFCQDPGHLAEVDHVVRGPRKQCLPCFFADTTDDYEGRAA